MSALAKLFSSYGYTVSGSDRNKSEQTESLAFYGIRVFIGEDGERTSLKDADLVVFTDAIPEENAELQTARRLNKEICSRADLLQKVSSSFERVIAVAGSHGKTTCTSMCAHILQTVGVPYTAHIGGEDLAFGNFYTSGLDYFLTEICEYKRNLLKIKADVGIVLNVDKDHMECYRDENDLIACFKEYCHNVSVPFVCADDLNCQRLGELPSFGIINKSADYRATELKVSEGRYAFTVEEYGKALCRLHLKAIGRHNVYNALAAFAVMRAFGFNEKELRKGLESFSAVKRRFERIGEYKKITFLCDYAHHPSEIAATVQTARDVCKGDLYVVFQPHTFSRTKLLMDEFVEVLRKIPRLMVYKTYPAREAFDRAGSSETLAKNVGNCLYTENVYALRTWIKTSAKEGDTVLFLGAGDVYHVAQYLLKE